jgi:hypothetical protein
MPPRLRWSSGLGGVADSGPLPAEGFPFLVLGFFHMVRRWLLGNVVEHKISTYRMKPKISMKMQIDLIFIFTNKRSGEKMLVKTVDADSRS